MRGEVSKRRAVYFSQDKPLAVTAKAALVVLLTAAVLCFPCEAQAPEQFADISARAAQARDAGNLPQAIDLYKQATQLKPDWQEGWWYLGVLEYSANQYPPAIDAFTHLLQMTPTAVPAMAMRGLCEFETAQYDDALRDLEQAVAHGAANDPHNEQIIRYHLAQLLTRAGRFQAALDQYQVFAKREIENPDLFAGVGLAGIQDRWLVSEIPAQDRTMIEAAGHAMYPLLAGHSMEASYRFAELFARYPNTPGLHYFYGFLLYPHDDASLTIDQFQRELVVAPDNQMARAFLAFMLMIDGCYPEAQAEAERVLAAQPATGGRAETSRAIAEIALGRALVETGAKPGAASEDAARGEALLKQILDRDPDNMEAHLGLAALYSRAGRREDALHERMECIRLAK
jgi:tetratricopeptide (TPR) repeat protein